MTPRSGFEPLPLPGSGSGRLVGARYRAAVPGTAASQSPWTAPKRVVVVGASLAGLRAAEELRRLGFDGELAVVGAEAHLPYDRPPLSKDFLAGEADAEDLALRRQPYDELALEWHLGVRATGLDLAARTVRSTTGLRWRTTHW